MGLGHQTHPGAGRPIKHPRRNLQPTACFGGFQITAESNAVRPLDHLMNANTKTSPRMPRVQQLPKLGTVGVLKPRCTTKSARMGRSATKPRSRWSSDQRRSARPERGQRSKKWSHSNGLENYQQGGPRMGSSSDPARLQSLLDKNWGQRQFQPGATQIGPVWSNTGESAGTSRGLTNTEHKQFDLSNLITGNYRT